MKHTPGPWIQTELSYRIEAANQDLITEVGSNNPADARLISAAPELLETLELVEKWMKKSNYHIHCTNTYFRVIGAIRKATGGAE